MLARKIRKTSLISKTIEERGKELVKKKGRTAPQKCEEEEVSDL